MRLTPPSNRRKLSAAIANKNMSYITPERVWEVVKMIISGIVGGYIVLRFTNRQKVTERRRAFRDKIACTLGELEATQYHMISSSFDRSVPIVRDECAKVRDDIRWWHKRKFDVTRVAFFQISPENPTTADVSDIPEDSPLQILPCEIARREMVKLLKELIDCAK